ncbi:MAG: hypothetical protein PVI90_15805 [Desulfobacteraceae bacterium]
MPGLGLTGHKPGMCSASQKCHQLLNWGIQQVTDGTRSLISIFQQIWNHFEESN